MSKRRANPEAPMLENFFDKFSYSSARNYCVVCLRSEQQRKLVSSKAFERFSTAVKIEKDWKHNLICYICEKQAKNALKFYKAASFASSIDTIFAELMYQKKSKKIDVFQRTNFKHILTKLGLGGGATLPKDWESELRIIRKRTKLYETQPLVVDNLGVKTITKTPTASQDVYVIPDDPPEVFGHVTSISARSGGVTLQRDVQSPRKVRDSLEQTDIGETAARNPMVLPSDVQRTPVRSDPLGQMDIEESATRDSFVLGSNDPKIAETLVILDEEDALSSCSVKLFESKPAEKIIPSLRPHTAPKKPVTRNGVPILVPLEKLLQKPKEVFTGDGLLVKTMDGNYTLHPIAIKEGVTTVPSLDAKIINGRIVSDKNHFVLNNNIQNSPTSLVTNIFGHPTLTPANTLKTPVNTVTTPVNTAMVPVNTAMTPTNTLMAPANTILTSANIIMPPLVVNQELQKNNKRELLPSELTTQEKKLRVLPTNQLMEKCDRIDWEDKIPMDVISFVDACDPNRNPRLDPNPSKTLPLIRLQENIVNNDVIDLS